MANIKIKKTEKKETNELLLTKKNIVQLKEELKNLIHFKRKENIDELKQARAQGDLSENSEYDSAKQKQVEIENRINEINLLLKKAKLISSSRKNEVTIGKKITLFDMKNGSELIFRIGTVSDIDIKGNVISNNCPLAKQIMNHKVGDQIFITGENINPYWIKILKIE